MSPLLCPRDPRHFSVRVLFLMTLCRGIICLMPALRNYVMTRLVERHEICLAYKYTLHSYPSPFKRNMTSEIPSTLSRLDSNFGANFNGLVLELTHDSPSHTNLIRVGEEKPIYTVTTNYPEGKHPLTTIVDGSGKFLGSLEWRPVLADLVVFGDKNAKPQKLSSWMNCGIFKGE